PRSSSPPKRCSPPTRVLPETTSSRHCPATFAAAPATSRSTKPSSWRPLGCGARTQSRHRRPCMASGKKATGFRVVGKAHRKVDATPKVTGVTKIAVEYEVLRPFPDALDAVEHPEPAIHDYADAGNIHKLIHLEFGDVDRGLAEADVVREDLFFFEGNTHLPMEQHAAVADWSADGKLTLWSATQTPHYVHRALAKVLELPAARIRVIACPNGGAFGGKSDPFSHEIVVA